MKVYHIPRDLSKSLEQQKRELKSQYKNFNYFASDGQKIHFMTEEEAHGINRIHPEEN